MYTPEGPVPPTTSAFRLKADPPGTRGLRGQGRVRTARRPAALRGQLQGGPRGCSYREARAVGQRAASPSYAAAAPPALPAVGSATRFTPRRLAIVMAIAIPRDLKLPVCSCDSSLIHRFCSPSFAPRRLHGNSEDGGPARRFGEAAVLITALGPGDAKAVGRRANYARHVHRDLHSPDIGERVVGTGIVVERQRAAISGEVVGA